MGTSASAGSISAKRPLIPRWLQSDEEPGNAQDAAPKDPTASGTEPVVVEASSDIEHRERAFSSAKSAISRAVSVVAGAAAGGYAITRASRAGGAGARARVARSRANDDLRRGLTHYVDGRGGAVGVADRLQKSAEVGARLYEALDRIARDGVDAALRELAVQPSDDSASALIDALTSLVLEQSMGQLEGVLDESMARAACLEALMMIYERGQRIADLDAAAVVDLVREFAVQSAYLLIERDVGTSIRDGSAREEDVSVLLDMLREIVRGVVELDLPPGIERRYTVGEVRDAIHSAYQDGFALFEEVKGR